MKIDPKIAGAVGGTVLAMTGMGQALAQSAPSAEFDRVAKCFDNLRDRDLTHPDIVKANLPQRLKIQPGQELTGYAAAVPSEVGGDTCALVTRKTPNGYETALSFREATPGGKPAKGSATTLFTVDYRAGASGETFILIDPTGKDKGKVFFATQKPGSNGVGDIMISGDPHDNTRDTETMLIGKDIRTAPEAKPLAAGDYYTLAAQTTMRFKASHQPKP